MSSLYTIILAAGKSSRFKTQSNKVLYPICGRPAIHYVLNESKVLRPKDTLIVVSPVHRKLFEEACSNYNCKFVEQSKPTGSGGAVRVALEKLPKSGQVLILSGDVPLLTARTMKRLTQSVVKGDAIGALLSMEAPISSAYGRIVRNTHGNVRGIVEAKDCSDAERAITEVNAGVYCVDITWLRAAIKKLGRHNAQGEYYLTDIVALACDEGRFFDVMPSDSPAELQGMNTREEAAQINKVKRWQIAVRHMDAGVDIVDPENVYIDDMVKIKPGAHIGPGVCLMGDSSIGTAVFIHAYSVVQDAVVGDGSVVGPFGRLRPGAHLSENVRIGNFVEIKKSQLARGVKVNHLTYIGDADIGEGSNIGCGTITCNYDGEKKHRTKIGKRVFVGSDVAFVAPVNIQDGAVIGAGSVVTQNVPSNALAVARGRQVNIKNWKKRKK